MDDDVSSNPDSGEKDKVMQVNTEPSKMEYTRGPGYLPRLSGLNLEAKETWRLLRRTIRGDDESSKHEGKARQMDTEQSKMKYFDSSQASDIRGTRRGLAKTIFALFDRRMQAIQIIEEFQTLDDEQKGLLFTLRTEQRLLADEEEEEEEGEEGGEEDADAGEVAEDEALEEGDD